MCNSINLRAKFKYVAVSETFSCKNPVTWQKLFVKVYPNHFLSNYLGLQICETKISEFLYLTFKKTLSLAKLQLD